MPTPKSPRHPFRVLSKARQFLNGSGTISLPSPAINRPLNAGVGFLLYTIFRSAYDADIHDPASQREFMLHEILLAGWSCPIGEMFDCEKLAEHCKKVGRWSFFVSSEVCNVPGGVARFVHCPNTESVIYGNLLMPT